jgi:predicted RNase H-like HicB family nuclease
VSGGNTAVTRRYKVLLEWDGNEAVWVSYVPDLNDLSTFGESHEEAIDNTHEAIAGSVEAAAKEGIEIPPSSSELAELLTVIATYLWARFNPA